MNEPSTQDERRMDVGFIPLVRSYYGVSIEQIYNDIEINLKYMAKGNGNIILDKVSGSLGNIVIKQYSYGTVITKMPDMSRVKQSELQKVKQHTFKEAVAYAQSIVRNEALKMAFAAKLEKGQKVYHLAIKEFMNRGK